jgi:biopolymer transport protein ExbB/biopolymer transport protein TolQ
MHITERFLAFTLLGAEWVLWLLIVLSVLSFAVMIERAYYFLTHTVDIDSLSSDLRRMLAKGTVADARARVKGSDSAEMTVMAAGLDEVERGVDAVAEAMVGRKAHERMRLERNLAFLGTLGNNAPFIGLFGTVIGVIVAFADLADGNNKIAMDRVMGGIAEALVATGVGLFVAIPAVIAYNVFQKRISDIEDNVVSTAKQICAFLAASRAVRENGAAAKHADNGKDAAKDPVKVAAESVRELARSNSSRDLARDFGTEE